jgi:uncharacterized membrane protein YkvA (DUF1232 family)
MEAEGGDPFPKDRFTGLLRRLPRYGRLAWRLGRSERISGPRRATLLAAAAYLVSPIDLVPGFIPVAGQLDDAAAVLLSLHLALRGLPRDERRAVLADAGLNEGDLAADLRTIGATYAWLGRQGARLTMRGVRGAGRAVRRIGARFGPSRRV